MKKRKRVLNQKVVAFLILLVFFYFVYQIVIVSRGRVLSLSNSSLNYSGNGYSNNNNNYGGPGGNNSDNNIKDEDDDKNEGNDQIVHGDNKATTPKITSTLTPTPISVPTPILTPADQTQNNQETINSNTQNGNQTIPMMPPSGHESFQGTSQDIVNNIDNHFQPKNEEVIVSITQRSVLSEKQQLKPIVTPVKSVLRVIEQKVKSVGNGQFLSKPVPVPTPMPSSDSLNSDNEVGLGPDSSIFYSLIDGSSVLLGAVDKEDRRIMVDEVELRSAEITMDKVLKKKGLNLGVSSENGLVLVDGEVKAYFDLPVFVDVFDHDLQLNTSEGKKRVVLTPSEAFGVARETLDMQFDDQSRDVRIVYSLGSLSYAIEGKEKYFLFGKYPVLLKKQVFVDAESGEARLDDDSLLQTIVKSASK